MGKRQRRKSERHLSSRTLPVKQARPEQPSVDASKWLLDGSRALIVWGVVLLALCTAIIYAQTVHVPPIKYDDTEYLTNSPYVNVSSPISRLGAVWNETIYADFYPMTTTTWLLDRELSDKSLPFDSVPFRVSHLIYASIGALLLIPLYRRLGLPKVLAVMGSLVYAVHPIHTEVLAWLSAGKTSWR